MGADPPLDQALTPAPGSDLDANLNAGKIALAHATLEIIFELNWSAACDSGRSDGL
jgi:hypothetical protein